MLSRERTVYTIDGPSHGKSEAVLRDFTFDECVAAAEQALDRFGLSEPVDWVGDAWGGHIGIRLATTPPATHPDHHRHAGAGIHAGGEAHKGLAVGRDVPVHGANGFIMKQLFESLLGAESIAAQPDQAETIKASFREADRKGMFHAMRSMMLHRTGIEDLLGSIKVPSLVMPVRDDVTGCRPDEARRTCAAIPDCRVEEVAGTGHISPLLIDRDRIARLLTEFWTAAVPKT